MKIREIFSKDIAKKSISIILLIVIGILSMTVVSDVATSPESYTSTIRSIDEKKATVMTVTATAAVASTALAAVPGDVTTPIANQIAELSSYLLIVICALVLEKSLLTVMGFLAFNILVPLSCLFFIVHIVVKKRKIMIFAFKLLALALVLSMLVPTAISVSDMIYEINKTTVEQVTSNLDEGVTETYVEKKSWIDKAIEKFKDGMAEGAEKAKTILNRFIDAIAVFIISYCVLPVAILFFAVWFVCLLFGAKFPIEKIDIKKFLPKGKDKNNKLPDKE